MPCPVCDCSMAQISGGMGRPLIYWCAVCGTLKTAFTDREQIDSPRWTKTLEREVIRDVVRARGGKEGG
jgi:hypothetical protein